MNSEKMLNTRKGDPSGSGLLSLINKHIVLVLGLIFCAGFAVVLWHSSRLTSGIIESYALLNAARYSRILTELRTLYTSEVVSRVRSHGIDIRHDYEDREGAIPLPVTLSMILGKKIGSDAGTAATLYSAYPFPWRKAEGGLKDSFRKAAWEHLTENADATFYRFGTYQGRPSLRYATADVMRAACISCHNTHPDTPKTDWKEGDVRGILEVILPLDQIREETESGLQQTFVLIAAMSVLSLASLAVALGRMRRESSTLEAQVHTRTGDLQEKNEELQSQIAEREQAEEALKAAKEEAEQAAYQVEAASRSMSDLLANLPTHIMMADRDLNITYVNPAMLRIFEKMKDHLPVAPGEVVGNNIAIFHQDSSHLIEVLSDPENLPHRARTQIGPEVVSLLITAIYDQDGEYSGPMVTWEIITEEVRLEKENRAAAERERQQAERERQQAEEERRRSQELQEKVDSMLEVVRAAAQGDLTHKITVGGEDTIGQMGAGLKQFLGELRDDIGVISENVRRMTEASNTMMDVSQQMGANAEEASSETNEVSASARTVRNSLQSVASAVEELTASIGEISSNANEASKMATGAVDMTESTHAVITQLGESSSKISDIIKLITSIAEQTNLLALNASIEAGRAGEAGKSFAVVASEVKQLSQEIAESAGNVRAQIEAIQSDTRNAVEAIREVSTTIQQINDIQAAIAGAVNQQAMTANEISQNINRAAEGSVNISDHVDSVAETARHTASGAGDTQAAASQLAEMASELQTFVSKFRVGEAGLEGGKEVTNLIRALKEEADRSGDGQMAQMASEVMKLLSESEA